MSQMSQLKFVLLGVLIAFSWIAVGAFTFGPLTATAQTQPATYQECFFGKQEVVDFDDDGNLEELNQDRRFNVPSGWTIVSGGGTEDGGIAFFCR